MIEVYFWSKKKGKESGKTGQKYTSEDEKCYCVCLLSGEKCSLAREVQNVHYNDPTESTGVERYNKD